MELSCVDGRRSAFSFVIGTEAHSTVLPALVETIRMAFIAIEPALTVVGDLERAATVPFSTGECPFAVTFALVSTMRRSACFES
jgi:hypothetical protein